MKVVYEVGKNREAGAHVQVIDNRDGSFEAHEGAEDAREMYWATLCSTHGNYCLHRTRMLAEEFAHHPTQWCETCQREGKARKRQTPVVTDAPNGPQARAKIDREVYLAVFNNWAVNAQEIATTTVLPVDVVNKSLRRLASKGHGYLVEGTHVNDDRELTWQTMFDVENGDTEEQAVASFEELY